MADLSTLDETAPGATDPVSQGDDAIRATRAAIKTSFGGADAGAGTQLAEHYLAGQHKFPRGTAAARPAAGNAGRIYLNTTDQRLERDTGAAWVQLNAVGFDSGDCSAALAVTTSAQDIPGLTATVDVATGSRVVVGGSCSATWTTATLVTFTLLQNGVATGHQAFLAAGAAGQVMMAPFGWAIEAPATGSVVYKVQAVAAAGSAVSVGGGTLANGQLWAQVL